MLEAKSLYQTIADTVHCHISQIKRMARNKNVWGTVVAPKLGPQGPPHILSQDQVQVLLCSPSGTLIFVLGSSRISST